MALQIQKEVVIVIVVVVLVVVVVVLVVVLVVVVQDVRCWYRGQSLVRFRRKC